MFATQQYMDTLVDRPSKRGRDDEQELVNGPVSFGEHRSKRLQSLPLRSSPKASQQWLASATITPLNASPAEYNSRPQSEPSAFSSDMCPQPSQDAEMDMTDVAPPAQHQATHLSAGHGSVDATTRMPTPIQPSFAAQVRGQQCEWAERAPVGSQVAGPSSQCVPRSMASEADWQSVQNNRRLPSPISECDDIMSSQLLEQHDIPDHCAHSAPFMENASPNYMEHPNAIMDIERPHTADADGSESPGPSPSRRGHMRSKHTINTWTWQPGMKRSFSIGYRADCEKCRLKVPGHFNHIIIS